jgi:hypothetical protein
MSELLRRLWRLEGTVDRRTYTVGGVVAAILKYAIDYGIARMFGRIWTPLSYLMVGSGEVRAQTPSQMLLVMLTVSIPFLWFGMAMTLLRLRDAGRSAGWAAFFFVPAANVLMFLLLCALPPRAQARERDLSGGMESALFAVIATAGFATVAVALSTDVMRTYGAGLFVAAPFCVGYLSAYLLVRRNPAANKQVYAVAILATLLLGGFLLALAWEGIICLLMSAPLAFPIALLGAYCGRRSAQMIQGPRSDAPAYMALLLLPLVMTAESAWGPKAPLYRVDSDIVINAPAATVWRNVVTFDEIRSTPEWYFRAGIAYPLRANIKGHGPGAIRTCEFTTGPFVEPIEVWDAPHLLRFSVSANPPPMAELSPYGSINAPHLHGFLVSQQGQFLLEPLPGNRTRLIGSTWYQHHLQPAGYWRIWSDAIIHRIHLRVLRHIKTLSERG